jgi:hypothetical protein
MYHIFETIIFMYYNIKPKSAQKGILYCAFTFNIALMTYGIKLATIFGQTKKLK